MFFGIFVLNRVGKSAIFVLNRVRVWGPRRTSPPRDISNTPPGGELARKLQCVLSHVRDTDSNFCHLTSSRLSQLIASFSLIQNRETTYSMSLSSNSCFPVTHWGCFCQTLNGLSNTERCEHVVDCSSTLS